jgi:hypothetical protein
VERTTAADSSAPATADALTFRRPLLEHAAERWCVAPRDTSVVGAIGTIGYRAAIERMALSAIDDERQHGRAQHHEDTANRIFERTPPPPQSAAVVVDADTFDGDGDDDAVADPSAEHCPVSSSRPITEDELIETLSPPQQRKWLVAAAGPELAEHDEPTHAEETLLEIGPPQWPSHADANAGSGELTHDEETRASVGRALLATKAFEVVVDNLTQELRTLHRLLDEAGFFSACEPGAIPAAEFAQLDAGRKISTGTRPRLSAGPQLFASFEAFAAAEAPLLEDLPEARQAALLWKAWRLHRLRAALAAFVQHVVFEGSRGNANDAQRIMATLGLHTTDVASPASADDDYARSARFDFRAAFLLGVVRDAVRERMGDHPL